MPIQQANDLAYREGLDLVEIAPQSKPPVCTIMDFGKWKFDEKKKEQKQKVVKPKEIRLRPVSSEHDIEHKVSQLREFLTEKRTVNVNMRFKYRELINKDEGKKIIDKIVKLVEDVGLPQQSPRFEGSNLTVRFTPK